VLSCLRDAASAVVATLLAPECAACASRLETPLDGPVCAGCWSAVRTAPPPLCRTCACPLPSWRQVSLACGQCPLCRRHPPAIDCAAAGGEYEGALRAIVHAFKYDARRTLAVRLGRLMCAAGADVLQGADMAVPVPLHPWREFRRGFNQAADLARQLDLPVARALRRTRRTAPQAGLTASARRRNVSHAFRLARHWGPVGRRVSALDGRVVVLVDDVRTTGATLDACARVLKSAGARDVRALTAARAPTRAVR
jgi:ComF family protein